MNPSDLELFTTRQLIDELMRRQTFLGVVVHSRDEMKSAWEDGERMFRIRYSSQLEHDEVRRLLAIVSDQMDPHCA